MLVFILFVLLIIVGAYAYNTRQMLIKAIQLIDENTVEYNKAFDRYGELFAQSNQAFAQDRARINALEQEKLKITHKHLKL